MENITLEDFNMKYSCSQEHAIPEDISFKIKNLSLMFGKRDSVLHPKPRDKKSPMFEKTANGIEEVIRGNYDTERVSGVQVYCGGITATSSRSVDTGVFSPNASIHYMGYISILDNKERIIGQLLLVAASRWINGINEFLSFSLLDGSLPLDDYLNKTISASKKILSYLSEESQLKFKESLLEKV